jgi:hypothetical protein
MPSMTDRIKESSPDDDLNAETRKLDTLWLEIIESREISERLGFDGFEHILEQLCDRYADLGTCSPAQRTCPCGYRFPGIFNLTGGGMTGCPSCAELVEFDEDCGALKIVPVEI